MAKGGDFEREISKSLTKWLIGKEKPYYYWRMPGSGALATIHEENKNLSGDIRSLYKDADFLTDYWSIECKTGYPNTSFWQHFKHLKNFALKDFWQQCVHDAYNAKKHPMLIYRKKGKQIIVGISIADVYRLQDKCVELGILPSITMKFELEEFPRVTFYDFYEFLEVVKPKYMKEIKI